MLEGYVMGLVGRVVMWGKIFTHGAKKASAVNQESG